MHYADQSTWFGSGYTVMQIPGLLYTYKLANLIYTSKRQSKATFYLGLNILSCDAVVFINLSAIFVCYNIFYLKFVLY